MRNRLIAFVCVLFLVACGESEPDTNVAVETSAYAEPPRIRAQSSEVNTNIKNATLEDFNDPSIWDEPRLQFLVLDTRDDGVTERIQYTMDKDGGNVRKVATWETLSRNETISPGMYVRRSPNNRYLLSSFGDKSGDAGYFDVFIGYVDLATKQVVKIVNSYRTDVSAWAPDSSYVYTIGEDPSIKKSGVYRYDIDSKKLNYWGKKDARTLFVSRDHLLMLVVHPGIVYFTAEGKRLGVKELNMYIEGFFQRATRFSLSPSKRYLLASTGNSCVFDLTSTSDKPVYCTKKKRGFRVSFYSESELYIVGGFKEKYIRVENFLTGTIKEIPIDKGIVSARPNMLTNVDTSQFPIPKYHYTPGKEN